MRKPTRRNFFGSLGAAAAATSAANPATAQITGAAGAGAGLCPLNGKWMFRFDSEGKGEAEGWNEAGPADGWGETTVPHTWNVDPGHAEYWGLAWYRRELAIPAAWKDCWVRLEFEAVYHTAKVWVNGEPVGVHERKGYTGFWFDISPVLRPGERNMLVVLADNTFRNDMLPRERSYDWVADGGITRPVNLHVTPRVFVERLWVDAEPDAQGGSASARIRVTVRNTTDQAASVQLQADAVEQDTGLVALSITDSVSIPPKASREVAYADSTIPEAKPWHFDHPNLYTLEVRLEAESGDAHSLSETFGIRKIEIRDNGFWLNGERMWLTGVERMGGSNPEYGMAEPEHWIRHDHDDMKELNCVFTRVHWQQDRRLLDYCDRNGILIQLEVPSWGPKTFGDLTPELEEAIQQNGLEQLRKMIARDRNHPCVFSWGLCNEVNGQNPPAKKFIRKMYEEARKLDPSRPLTYASNSLQKGDIGSDASGEMDFIMWNDYYESWMGQDVPAMEANLRAIHEAFPAKPIVISEYGYCECRPAHSGGDPKRIDILYRHNEIFRKYDWVGGTIFFNYNDYRTHLGDKGIGPLKQRVHGVVDLYGNRKPSFEDLRRESSPIEELHADANRERVEVRIRVRRRLPGYRLRGYKLRWIIYGFGGLPMEAGEIALPELAPGAEHALTVNYTENNLRRIQLDVMRPTRFSAATTVLEV